VSSERAPSRAIPGRLAALVAVAALALAACSPSTPTVPPPTGTSVPIAQTPWPAGTVGQYGLRIDPSLLGRLPSSVEALRLFEDATSEEQDMNSADLAKNFDAYAASAIGIVGDANWLSVAIGTLKTDARNADFYSAWVNEYGTGACSQADGIASTAEETINDFVVDVTTCAGGPVAYVLMLDEGTLLSMWGMGPRDLGRKLIGSLP
jgi:hypothetical protein